MLLLNGTQGLPHSEDDRLLLHVRACVFSGGYGTPGRRVYGLQKFIVTMVNALSGLLTRLPTHCMRRGGEHFLRGSLLSHPVSKVAAAPLLRQ